MDVKETAIRVLALTILTSATLLAATPVHAQTYAPGYPVCLQAFTIDGEHIECAYATMAQCQAAVAGRGAQCLTNPYYGNVSGKPPGARRRPARLAGMISV